ncbi:hypothetical protein AVEN_275544-1 [Araneus ventricosus]|uniref:Uncharacterized protein n=1 Tax=Araneus ventricosus TaxID=182803 RepID=A0A4Y2P721_ARAVE|nr:hypothetical protein AVEN_275544-1 [Araneus ventricosus]
MQCLSFAPCVSTRGQMAVNFKRRPSGMTQSGKALSAPFYNRTLLLTWEARSLFPWESLRVLFRTSQDGGFSLLGTIRECSDPRQNRPPMLKSDKNWNGVVGTSDFQQV